MGRAPVTAGVGAIVLGGGKSARLGFDKALALLDGQALVRALPARLGARFAPVVVVADRPNRYAIPSPQLVDAVPDAGPLAGIAAGLQALAPRPAFVCACDMPLLRLALMERLVDALGRYDLAIPERAGRLEPLCAVYAASCLPAIRRLLAERRLRVNGVAAEVRARAPRGGMARGRSGWRLVPGPQHAGGFCARAAAGGAARPYARAAGGASIASVTRMHNPGDRHWRRGRPRATPEQANVQSMEAWPMVTCESCGVTGYPQYADSTVRCRGCGGRVRPATPEELRSRGTDGRSSRAASGAAA